MMVGRRLVTRLRFCVVAASWLAWGVAARAADEAPIPKPLTLAEALQRAEIHNAQLPAARYRVDQARARVRQARSKRYPSLSLDGDVHGGTPQAYASGDAFIRLLAQTPLYAGGELRAGLEQSRAEAASVAAGYRISQREVAHSVRMTFGQVLHASSTIDFRRRGIERLQTYLSAVQARQAGGEGVGADVLRTKQRLASARADVAAAIRALHESRMTLADLLGLPPTAELSLAPLPQPTGTVKGADEPWLQTPDVQQARADIQARQAGVQAARAARNPHVTLEADVGVQPTLGDQNRAPLNNGTGPGAEVTLNFSVPLWNAGLYRSKVSEARAALDEARQQRVITERSAHLSWGQALSDLHDLYAEYQARTANASAARDAYLQAESLYRGGQSNALGVLDAYDAWTQAEQSLLDVTFSYRAAEADLYRWGAP